MKYFFMILILTKLAPALYSNNQEDYLYIYAGISDLAIKDYFISEEKYSGTLTGFELGFRYMGVSSFQDLSFSFKRGSEIKNHSVDANILLFSMKQDFSYKR